MSSMTSNGYLLGIKIEGIGDATQTTDDGITRWVTSRKFLQNAATVDPDGIYTDGLLFWPTEIGHSVDFRSGVSSVGRQTFRLRGKSAVWTEVMRYAHASVGKLDADITKAAASITLDTAGLAGTIYLEREAILLGTESPSKTYATDGAGDGARGVLGTTAEAHSADPDQDRECFATPHTLSGRLVELFTVDRTASTAYPEVSKWIGVLRRISAPTPDVIEIVADAALSLVRGAKLMTEQYRGRVANVPEQNPNGDWTGVFVVNPADWPPSGRPEDVPAAGHSTDYRMVLQLGGGAAVVPYALSLGGDSGQVYTHAADVLPFGGSPRVGAPNFPDIGEDAYEIISSHPAAPANNSVPGASTLPLASNPGILLLQLLLTTRGGGNHGTYDTAVPNIAGGIPAALVNVTKILEWTQRKFGGIDKNTGDMESFHLGTDGKSESLWDAVQRILRPWGAVLVQGSAGTLEVASFADAVAWGASNTITAAQILAPAAPISQDRRIEDAIDRLECTYNGWPGRKPDRLNVEDAIKHKRTLPGWSSTMQIDLSAVTDVEIARSLAEQLVVRYHQPIPRIKLETTRVANFYPGQVVQVSHDLIFAPDATRSVTSAVMLVVGRTEQLDGQSHSIVYDLDYVGAIYERQGKIAPSAEVASWSAPNATLTSNKFTDDTYGPLNLDVPNDTGSGPWEFADVVQLCDLYGTVIHAALSIVSVSDDTIELDPAEYGGTPPSPTDIIRPAVYGSSVARQTALFVYIADANNSLDGDDPYEYVQGDSQE
jgi:hypothetical protein